MHERWRNVKRPGKPRHAIVVERQSRWSLNIASTEIVHTAANRAGVGTWWLGIHDLLSFQRAHGLVGISKWVFAWKHDRLHIRQIWIAH